MPIDPVCGLSVQDEEGAVEAELRGRRYLFCSPGCRRRFTAPGRALAWARRMAALALASGALLMALPWLGLLPEPSLGWALLALGTAVQVLAGAPFYQGVVHALRQRRANLDTLAALGTSAAWLFGVLEVLSPELLVQGRQQYYFEVSALVLGFLLLGRMMEQRLRREAGDEVQRLMELQPHTARLLRDGAEVEVALEDVVPGDVVLVREGERITVDGTITHGRGAVDEKLLTGESLPVDKGVGDKVIAGAVNVGGALTIEATNVGRESALARIVELIERAQENSPRALRWADAVSARFVPGVALAALLTFAAWHFGMGAPLAGAFSTSVAVLLVASPAAVGLATPSVLSVAVGKAARRGILVKGAEALEQAAKIDVVVFDKTGTVTRGQPALTDVHAMDGMDERALLALAASAEQGSEHPLGRTMLRHARDHGIAIAKARKAHDYAGAGVEAIVDGEEVMVGSAQFLKDRRIKTQSAEGERARLVREGKTVVFVARGDEVAGLVAFADPIRDEAPEAIASLKALGVETALVTGDNVATAGAIAAQLGIKRVFAEITPQGKAGAVRAFQDGAHVVAMVGDGINDAPALAQAHVGIAIGAGAEVAVEAGDLVLMRSDPRDVPALIQLSREAAEKVKQNLRWAFVYHAALVPIAAVGLLNPLLAGIAMAFSTVPVVLNARSIARRWAREEAPSGR